MPIAPLEPVSGGLSFTIFAGGTKGYIDGPGKAARFDAPAGLDVDALGRLCVSEAGGHRIRRIEVNGQVSTIAGSVRGWLDGPAEVARFDAPQGLAVRRDGTLIIADTGNHRIRAIAPNGDVTTIAGSGVSGFADGPSAQAKFQKPFAVALTALDEVLVADTGNHRIRRINRDGTVVTLTGGGAGYIDGDLSAARFNGPADISVNSFGRIYVADLRNHAVRVLDLNFRSVQTLAGNGEEGDADGAAAVARFHVPSGLAIDEAGSIYVADTGNRMVRRVSKDGSVSTLAVGTATPSDIAFGPAAATYVSDTGNDQILISR